MLDQFASNDDLEVGTWKTGGGRFDRAYDEIGVSQMLERFDAGPVEVEPPELRSRLGETRMKEGSRLKACLEEAGIDTANMEDRAASRLFDEEVLSNDPPGCWELLQKLQCSGLLAPVSKSLRNLPQEARGVKVRVPSPFPLEAVGVF